jgi:phage major head subunit gpT-like protein
MPEFTLPNLNAFYTGVQTAYNQYLGAAPGFYKDLCMQVSSKNRQETYPRLDMIPGVREWIGDRVVHRLAGSTYTVVNKKFEETLGISKDDFEDDNFGLFMPAIQQLGMNGAEYPDLMVAGLINNGGSAVGPDGQYFFDTDHPSWDSAGAAASASNYQSGSGAPWYLFDLSKPLKPFLFQTRVPFSLVARQSLQDPAVFDRDELLWGIRGRMAAGYGLWHLGYKSKATLNKANLAAAVAAMRARYKPDGTPININPTHLYVPASLEGTGRGVVNNEFLSVAGGSTETNEWKGAFQLRVNPWLAIS